MSETAENRGSWSLPLSWREAAVFGALWGALEITLGSFLHATRIPLAGVIMSAMAVAVLVAASMLIRRPWFALRAALICAAVRALSPEGVMPGPMTAIVWQGLLVSTLFLLVRHPLITGLLAGPIATLSTQVQALVTRLVFFGIDLWDLFLSLLRKSEELLGLQTGQGWIAVTLYLILIALLGVAGGIFGWLLGRRACKLRGGCNGD